MITANTWLQMPFLQWRATILKLDLKKRQIPDGGPDTETEPLKAFVNHGRWLVACPCGGAEYAFEEGWMMCRSCFNGYMKHKIRRVEFPDPAFRANLETLLLNRPLDNRNWTPGETLEQIAQENIAHAGELLTAEIGNEHYLPPGPRIVRDEGGN